MLAALKNFLQIKMSRNLLDFSYRKFGTFRALRSNLKEPLDACGECPDDAWKKWRNIFMYVGVPGIILSYVNTKLQGKEHENGDETKLKPPVR